MTVFDIKESAMDALSQIEKQHLDETGAFTEIGGLSPYPKLSEVTQNPLAGTGNVAAAFGGGGLLGNGQGNTLIDQSFSNNLGQSFLINSNFNSESMPLAAKSF